jgi:BirA family transcriptional regulator, biotin operon repressor / biotin---[acetyl-CoA-carboxylase] ligase
VDAAYVPFDAEKVQAAAEHLVIGSDLRYFPVVDSTNRAASDLPAGSWRHGTVVVADYQEAGRGRLQRTWVAPPGSSLLVSILLAPPADVAPSDLMMVAAVAVADAIREVSGLQAELKWPNDVLLEGRKLGGILAERSEQQGKGRVVLGIGLNLNFDPRDCSALADSSTSLQLALGHSVEREAVALALFKYCELWYGYLTRDPNSVFSTWAARLQTVGHAVLVSGTDRRWQGVATGVQRDGALLVRDDKGETHAVYAADVSIRRLGGFTSR